MIDCTLRTTVALLLLSATAPAQLAEIRTSLCRVSNTSEEPNYRTPWLPGQTGGGTGTGWVVGADRVMTNAHVVSNARFLTLEKENDPHKYIAEVAQVGHDCDLAVLKVKDPAFFKNTKPLPLGEIPVIESAVRVYGYPIGGDRLSVTRGIVSRIDFRTYSHSMMDSHLTVQIDAAINPGNSGGPVMQEGKVVGVAFQGYSGDVAQNVGYMIPTPVIKHFLKAIEGGNYHRYMDLSIGIFNTQNPAMRRSLGLPNDDSGVVVSSVAAAGVCDGALKVGDVILAVDGHAVASDGLVDLDGERVMMAEIAERKFIGDTSQLSIVRDRKPLDVTIKFDRPFPFVMQANAYDVQPTYILFAGLLFQPLNRNLFTAYQFQNSRVNHYYDDFISKEVYREHPEIIVLSSILPDPINAYLGEFHEGIVDEVNDRKIRTLRDLAEALEGKPEFYVIKFWGDGRPLVLERSAVEAARNRIKQRYNVLAEQNLDENAS